MAQMNELDSVLKKQLMLQKMVSELIFLSSSQVNPGEFLSSFLRSAVRLIDGAGGTIWVKREQKLEPVFHTGKTTEIQPIEDDGDGSDEGVLEKITADVKPFVFPMRSTDGNSEGLIGIYIPLEIEDGLFGVLKVVKQRATKVVYQEEIELLSNMGNLVRMYLTQLNLPKVVGRVEELQRLFKINQEIFSSIDGDEIAYTVANLVPTLVRCERCIVGLVDRGKLRVKAITGQDFVEKKSAAVRNIKEILEYVGEQGEAVTITPEAGEGEEQGCFRELVNSYFDVQPFRVMRVMPVKDGDRLLGVISIESSEDSVFPPNDESMFNFVCNQTGVALRHARLYKQIPCARAWHKLAAFKIKVAEWPRFRAISGSVLIVLMIAAVFLVNIDNKISGDCEVLPLSKYYARTRIDGVLKEFLVDEGDRVEAGSVVALLDDVEIKKRLREAEARLEVTRANMLKFFGMGQMADYAIEALKLKGIEKEIELLQSDLEDTRIVVEGSGVVLTPGPRFAERLGKPVSRGEELVEVGQVDELLLAVAVPEKGIKFIESGQKIRFLLNSLPEKHFEVRVDSIRQKAEPRPEGNFFIVESNVDLPAGSFKPGMKGKAKIYADKAPIWKVYLGDMINFFRIKVFF